MHILRIEGLMRVINICFNVKRQGVSFLELLVSILVLAIVAACIALALPTTASMSNKTDKMENATSIAHKYIETVKSEFFNDPTLFYNLQEGTTPPIDVSSDLNGNGTFDVATNVTIDNNSDVDGTSYPCLFTLKVTVSPLVNGKAQTSSDQAVSTTTIIRRDR